MPNCRRRRCARPKSRRPCDRVHQKVVGDSCRLVSALGGRNDADPITRETRRKPRSGAVVSRRSREAASAMARPAPPQIDAATSSAQHAAQSARGPGFFGASRSASHHALSAEKYEAGVCSSHRRPRDGELPSPPPNQDDPRRCGLQALVGCADPVGVRSSDAWTDVRRRQTIRACTTRGRSDARSASPSESRPRSRRRSNAKRNGIAGRLLTL